MTARVLHSRWAVVLFIWLACLGCICTSAFEASIDLGPAQRRCIGEQLSKHVLIVGEFRVSHPAPTIPGGGAAGPLLMHVHVTDPANKTPVFQQSSRDRIKTGFTSTKPGVHMFCVKNLSQQQITVDVQLLWGPAARDYSQLAKAEHIDEVMLQLLQLQDKLKLYHNNILFMRERDEQMRQQNEQTATQLILFCGVNIFFLVASSVISGFFFKRFFRSKKII
ncbi:transmembrane trafficking protein, transmembrane protein Tmp21 precursor, putative [Eimeria acervulina]|uniref:Transmembrane trafficking protein, transmembrane protein Tmp21, putative n=1 Tax=Eimeria acervulina TaxID=5801 RepID=U6GC34_EIMAC|nr:transmembrane trafficking protein, transmembrane protein Tmp21 precursor, putative [Eimeria acervulina]CDI77695.1 transmembrane trafficking protein, transmembrane protein Tmp21 precursor, putative [Eimeria acervulina]